MLNKKSLFINILCLYSFSLSCKQFDDEILHTIIKNSIQCSEQYRLPFILKELNTIYGTTEHPNFYLFNGGSTFGFVGMLYASCTEYLFIYGSPLANGGHSGRYLLNIRDFVYRGKVTVTTTKNLEGTTFLPGECTFMEWGTAHHYCLEKNTWMLEHAVGFTPSALPFLLLGFTATGDVIGLSQIMFAYGKEVTKNLIKFS